MDHKGQILGGAGKGVLLKGAELISEEATIRAGELKEVYNRGV